MAGAGNLSASREAGSGWDNAAPSGQASLGSQDQMIAVDVGRDPLDPDQLTTEFFQTIVIESKAELDAAIGDAALGDEAPDDLLQDLLKVQCFRSRCRGLRPCLRTVDIAPRLKFRSLPAM